MSTEDPEEALRRYGGQLADAIDRALPAWVRAGVERVMADRDGRVPPEVEAAAQAAGQRARQEVVWAVRELLAADVDDQRTTPLALLRFAVRFPTEVLAAAGVAPLERDAYEVRAFPDDRYGLAPASLSDFGPEVGELGIAWGAAKAFVHRARHGG